MKIELLIGNDCFEAIQNQDFIQGWNALSQQSNYFVLNQRHNFVASWYLSYRKKYNPIIVVAYDEIETNMVAIMPLAMNTGSGELVYAGDGQAEYNTFISKKEYEREFIVKALISIKHNIDISSWCWAWMPPNIDQDWLKDKRLEQEGIYIRLEQFDSPIYDLSDASRINKIKKNKSIKSKINRLNRVGELRIERIVDLQRAESLMDKVIEQSSFRNLALYNKSPFLHDTFRKEWYLRKMAMPDNDEHFTVLWQGDNLLACNFGSCTGDTVVIGTFTYDPLQGGHSPGKVFIIKLIEYLMEKGYRYLDLTPGGDAYKESLCNGHNALTKPRIYFNYKKYIKTKLVAASRRTVKRSLNGKVTNRDIESLKALREKRLVSVFKREVMNLYNNKGNNKDNLLVYKKPNFDYSFINNSANVNVQKYSDLLLYKNTNGYLTNKEVAFDALKKFERGDILYSMISNEKLIAFVWLARSGKKHTHSCLVDRINKKPKSLFIYDIYVDKSYKGNIAFKTLITGIAKDIKGEAFSDLYLIKSLDVDKYIFKEVGFEQPSCNDTNR